MSKKGFIKKDYALMDALKPYNLKSCEIDLIIILLSFNGCICNYKQKTLSNKLNINDRTLRRYIKHLKDLNFISVKRKGSHSLFILNIKVISGLNGSEISIKPPKKETSEHQEISSADWFSNYWEEIKEEEKKKQTI